MKAGTTIRPEWAGEEPAISALVTAAFAGVDHAGGNEAAIVEGLRAAGDLALSLVATDPLRIIGHAAFSPVAISDGTQGWFGLGPVAVLPAVQRLGIGGKLIRAGLAMLGARGARGVVVLGSPAYYGRFGFRAEPGIAYSGVPAEYFQALVIAGDLPRGTVRYAPAFG